MGEIGDAEEFLVEEEEEMDEKCPFGFDFLKRFPFKTTGLFLYVFRWYIDLG